ncbi:DNA translocase FtsK [Anoxybacillus suryakundensis]|uniref:FtsK/SpoIIIE family/Ftsk gamma domain n=1 Tax=Anoxybacillus suryakundensis TaxID=1325335 RepID=A0A0K6GJP2_9BACL|nr:DNA translocase FtsK [Anoxybacillus suryakundensis]CUA78862.1 FtsK/SpoIIIE family/Ftsk gamma domain [Anoxybacillus suryakundensis]
MGWLKALFRYLFGEQHEPKKMRKQQQSVPTNEYKEIEAKVVYEYPRGKFRFPLIPDEPKGRIKERTYEQKNDSFKKKTYRIERKESESRTFRPTDVPSPVFGYKRIEHVERKKEHDVVVEFELPIVETVETNERVHTQVEESVERQLVDETNEHVHMTVSEPLHEGKEVDCEKEVVEEHMEQHEEEETKEREQREEKLEQIHEERTRQRSGVPYNVMMLKQDREKWKERQQKQSYVFPSLSLLHAPSIRHEDDEAWLKEQTERLNETFKNFNVGATVVHVTQGPTVTRFEVQPELGVKVNKITNLADDIKLNLAAVDIRIEAPIPGKNTIGIEVPNRSSRPVFIREVLQSEVFQQSNSPLTVALGLDISGKPIVTDLKKMPHGLIAGATGSGKSVCMNAMLVSLLYKAAPHEVKLLLIDPKMVELAPYNHIPHLVSPVITDAKAATAALKWAVSEMERRYELFAHTGVRDIVRYNELIRKAQKPEQHLPYIVIVIDELADLMMVAPADVEEAICRIAQKARACGIHLLVATQRPSVDVITGLIKANIPTRIAFSVSSQIDSRTIIDINGAEKLLGRGDMLFLENGTAKPVRLQGNFVSDEEIERVVAHVRQQMEPSYLFQHDELLQQHVQADEDDELFYEACEFVVQQGGASTSSLQRRFRIGYNRAARLIEMMEQRGIVSAPKGSKPRDVLIDEQHLEQLQDTI